MRFASGNETREGLPPSAGVEQSSAIQSCSTYEYKNRALSENLSPKNQDHREIVARATNDAVRDWDVKSGALAWPQGLQNLLGYEQAATTGEIGFWQKNIHPEDRARTSSSIRDALGGSDEHWSGEYRFLRADGDYVHLLE